MVTRLISYNLIRPECGEPTNVKLNDHEQRLIAAEFADYYEEHWSSIILAIMQFKNPLVANAHNLT